MKLVLWAPMKRACLKYFFFGVGIWAHSWPGGHPVCQTEEHKVLECNQKILRWKSVKGFLIWHKKLPSWICSWTWNDALANAIHFARSLYAASSLLSTWSRGAWSSCDISHINCFLVFKPLSPSFVSFWHFLRCG